MSGGEKTEKEDDEEEFELEEVSEDEEVQKPIVEHPKSKVDL